MKQDPRERVESMCANLARASLKLMAQRPGVPLYLHYQPAIGEEWGYPIAAWDDDDPRQCGHPLATTERMPINRDIRALTAWIVLNMQHAPICGA